MMFNILLKYVLLHQLFETSAQSDTEGGNIDGIFMTLAHKLTKQRPLMPLPMVASLQFNNENLHRANVISITRSLEAPMRSTDSNCSC